MKMSSLEDWDSRSSAEVKASSAPSSIPGDDQLRVAENRGMTAKELQGALPLRQGGEPAFF